MSPRQSRTKKHDVTNIATDGWDMMIALVLRQLQTLEGMSGKLTFALNYFQEQKRNGEPFPGEEKLKQAGLI